MSRRLRSLGVIALVALASAGSTSAMPADLPALEKVWHSCVREAYDRASEQGSRAGRERNALDECKTHEDEYVAALMAARSIDENHPILAWARTWTAYVFHPVTTWITSLRR